MQVGKPLQIRKKKDDAAVEKKAQNDAKPPVVDDHKAHNSDDSDKGHTGKGNTKPEGKEEKKRARDNDIHSDSEEDEKNKAKPKRARAAKKPKLRVLINMELTSSKLLNKFVEQMSTFIESCEVTFSANGIEIGTIDTNHISYCILNIASSDMNADTFVCPERQALGVNLTVLAKVLKACGNGSITFHQTGANTDVLGIRCQNKGSSSNYTIKLLNIDQEKLGIPPVQPSFHAKIDADKFLKMVQSVKPFDDHIRIFCHPLKFRCASSKNSEQIDADHELVVTDDNHEDIFIQYDKVAYKQHSGGHPGKDTTFVRQEYGLKYVLAFCTVIAAAASHAIAEFTYKDNPARFGCTCGNGSSFYMWLTPKTIEDDDDDASDDPDADELIVSDGDDSSDSE